jgi:hypothetical protein
MQQRTSTLQPEYELVSATALTAMSRNRFAWTAMLLWANSVVMGISSAVGMTPMRPMREHSTPPTAA